MAWELEMDSIVLTNLLKGLTDLVQCSINCGSFQTEIGRSTFIIIYFVGESSVLIFYRTWLWIMTWALSGWIFLLLVLLVCFGKYCCSVGVCALRLVCNFFSPFSRFRLSPKIYIFYFSGRVELPKDQLLFQAGLWNE